MDQREERIVIKFLGREEQGSKAIQARFRGILGDLAESFSIVKRWPRRFVQGDTSCKDPNRPGRPLTVLADVSSELLLKYPFIQRRILQITLASVY
jgi:hypothetical protein